MTRPAMEAYLAAAAALGFSRVFMSLILSDLHFSGAAAPDDPVFEETFALCREQGLFITLDTNDRVFEYFGGINATLRRFKEQGVAALRIDSGLAVEELAELSRNDQGMGLELNVSDADPLRVPEEAAAFFDTLAHQGNPRRLTGCFNFYPRRGTGLRLERVRAMAALLRERDIASAAFVSSLVSPSVLHAPGRGVCTVEALRETPPEIAAAVLFLEGIDTVLVGDPEASGEELAAMAESGPHSGGSASGSPTAPGGAQVRLPVVYHRECPPELRRALAGRVLSNRRDTPADVIRATATRGIRLPPFRSSAADPLNLTMDNERSGQYAGELHIVLNRRSPDNAVNVLGFIHPDAAPLVPYLVDGSVSFTLYDYAETRKNGGGDA
jgi:hypothetical protein